MNNLKARLTYDGNSCSERLAGIYPVMDESDHNGKIREHFKLIASGDFLFFNPSRCLRCLRAVWQKG